MIVPKSYYYSYTTMIAEYNDMRDMQSYIGKLHSLQDPTSRPEHGFTAGTQPGPDIMAGIRIDTAGPGCDTAGPGWDTAAFQIPTWGHPTDPGGATITPEGTAFA